MCYDKKKFDGFKGLERRTTEGEEKSSMDERLFVKRTKIEYSYCDWSNAMKLSYLLGEAQEVSMEHCDALGIGGDYFMSIHKAFL